MCDATHQALERRETAAWDELPPPPKRLHWKAFRSQDRVNPHQQPPIPGGPFFQNNPRQSVGTSSERGRPSELAIYGLPNSACSRAAFHLSCRLPLNSCECFGKSCHRKFIPSRYVCQTYILRPRNAAKPHIDTAAVLGLGPAASSRLFMPIQDNLDFFDCDQAVGHQVVEVGQEAVDFFFGIDDFDHDGQIFR